MSNISKQTKLNLNQEEILCSNFTQNTLNKILKGATIIVSNLSLSNSMIAFLKINGINVIPVPKKLGYKLSCKEEIGFINLFLSFSRKAKDRVLNNEIVLVFRLSRKDEIFYKANGVRINYCKKRLAYELKL